MAPYRDLVEMILAVIAVISAGAMISHVNVQRGNKKFWLYNPFLIADYISVTRKDTGRIGTLFWIFLIAIISLLTSSFFQFAE